MMHPPFFSVAVRTRLVVQKYQFDLSTYRLLVVHKQRDRRRVPPFPSAVFFNRKLLGDGGVGGNGADVRFLIAHSPWRKTMKGMIVVKKLSLKHTTFP